jgi:hypothetical protein
MCTTRDRLIPGFSRYGHAELLCSIWELLDVAPERWGGCLRRKMRFQIEGCSVNFKSREQATMTDMTAQIHLSIHKARTETLKKCQ